MGSASTRSEFSARPSRFQIAARRLRLAWRLLTDPPYRHMMWLYWWPRRDAFQPFNDTLPDRYPRIFKFVQTELGAGQPLDILSFGCATGEEVFSLRRYFPAARIRGVDINRANVAAARARLAATPDERLSFMVAASTQDEPAAAYDAIFCMAVLRHGSLGRPGITRCDPLLRFDDAARTFADFHRCLKPGGLLILRHSSFRLRDAPVGACFETRLTMPLQARKGPRSSGRTIG
jgi:SAM-dependent methyltransferase